MRSRIAHGGLEDVTGVSIFSRGEHRALHITEKNKGESIISRHGATIDFTGKNTGELGIWRM